MPFPSNLLFFLPSMPFFVVLLHIRTTHQARRGKKYSWLWRRWAICIVGCICGAPVELADTSHSNDITRSAGCRLLWCLCVLRNMQLLLERTQPPFYVHWGPVFVAASATAPSWGPVPPGWGAEPRPRRWPGGLQAGALGPPGPGTLRPHPARGPQGWLATPDCGLHIYFSRGPAVLWSL